MGELDHVGSTGGGAGGVAGGLCHGGPRRACPVLDCVAARRLDAAAVAEDVELDGVDRAVLAEVHAEGVLGRRRARVVAGPTVSGVAGVEVLPVGRLARGVRGEMAVAGGGLGVCGPGVVGGVVHQGVAGDGDGDAHIDGGCGRDRGRVVHAGVADEDLEARSAVVFGSVAVPDDGDVAAVVSQVVQDEVVPRVGHQRLEHQRVAGLGLQPQQSGDDQVHEPRMEIVRARARVAFGGAVVACPGAGVGVVGLRDERRLAAAGVGPAVHVDVDVGVQGLDVVVFVDLGLGVVLQDVGHRLERLGGGEGPRPAAPTAARRADLVSVV